MRRAAELLKKQIVQVDTGDIVGTVADLLIDPTQNRLVAVVTTTGRWLREAALIEWDRLVVWTGDVILVKPGTEPLAATPHFQQLLERKIHASGTPVLSESGAKIGAVGELLIDDAGAIAAYAINRGFLGSERQFVLARDVVALGAGALIIRDGSIRDAVDTAAPGRADDLLHSIRLPLTGSLVTVESEAPAQGSPEIAEASPAELPALASPGPAPAEVAAAEAAVAPAETAETADQGDDAAPGVPDEAAGDDAAPGVPDLPAPPATGVTRRLTATEIEAIRRLGDAPSDLPPAPPE